MTKTLSKYLPFVFLLWQHLLLAQPSNSRWEYIQRYKEIAVSEMQRTGVPASIKLAQGILESGAGSSTLARNAKNHFGMKCGAEWRGKTFYLQDDDFDQEGKLIESCFRVYETAEESFIAHSDFLRDPNKAYRYGFLFRLDSKDYKRWANGLQSAGYATSPTYANALIGIIDQHQLFIYDVGDGNPQLVDVILVNDVKMTMTKPGQTPAEIAERYNVKLKCLLAYNEGLKGPNQTLEPMERIYLQKKRRFFRGEQRTHVVKRGETMYSISQAYGVRLKSLRKKNKMPINAEPALNEVLYLRGLGWGRKTPKLRNASFEPERPSTPFDEGTGEIPHIDETNAVDPKDLPKTNPTDNNNSNNNSSNNSSNNNNSNNSGGTKPNTTNNSGGVNNNGTTKPTTNPTTQPTTNNGSNNTNSGGTKPTTTGSNGTTKPSTNTNIGENTNGNTSTTTNNNTNNNSGAKPTTTSNNGTTKPSTNVNSGESGVGNPTKPTTSGGTKPTTATGNGSTTTKPTTTKPTTGSATTTTTTERPTGIQYHTVEPKETLYSIAKRYGLTVDGLKLLNGMTTNDLKVGQQLRLN
jgi:LysM repeat protein